MCEVHTQRSSLIIWPILVIRLDCRTHACWAPLPACPSHCLLGRASDTCSAQWWGGSPTAAAVSARLQWCWSCPSRHWGCPLQASHGSGTAGSAGSCSPLEKGASDRQDHPGSPCEQSPSRLPPYPGVGDQKVSDGVALTFLLLLQLHCDVSIGHQSIGGPVLGTLLLGGQTGERWGALNTVCGRGRLPMSCLPLSVQLPLTRHTSFLGYQKPRGPLHYLSFQLTFDPYRTSIIKNSFACDNHLTFWCYWFSV